MPTVIPRLPVPRPISLALSLTLSATLSATALAAGDPGDSLCQATSVDELAALGPLTFETPTEGAPSYCVFEAAGDGSYRLTLATSGISYDRLRDENPEAEEYSPGGRPATGLEGSIIVDLGDELLVVTLDPGDSPDAAGVDPIDYALSVAEVVVPALGVAPPSEEETAGDALQPPPVDGIEWGRTSVVTASELIEADAEQAAVWQPLADAAGVDPSELRLSMDANARDAETGEVLGNYAAIQVAGADGEQLGAAIISWMGTVSGEDVSTDVVSLGGKDVTALSAGGQLRGYLYVAGDIVHAITMSEDDAARVLEALP
jgi:hypothetical protein